MRAAIANNLALNFIMDPSINWVSKKYSRPSRLMDRHVIISLIADSYDLFWSTRHPGSTHSRHPFDVDRLVKIR
jgi:hypothetical protein